MYLTQIEIYTLIEVEKSVKKYLLLLALVLSMPLFSACTRNAPTWQEQYDLGIRYLSEGDYEEAIIAFTAAIEIDPKQAPAYVGRGDAYIGLGETEENLTAAQADYEKAIELDETLVSAYLGLADIYIKQGDNEKAREILNIGIEKTNSEDLKNQLLLLPPTLPERLDSWKYYIPATDTVEKAVVSVIEIGSHIKQVSDDEQMRDVVLAAIRDLDSEIRTIGGKAFWTKLQNDALIRINQTKIGNPGDKGLYLEVEYRPRTGPSFYYNSSVLGDEVHFDIVHCETENYLNNGEFTANVFNYIGANFNYTNEYSGNAIDDYYEGDFVYTQIQHDTGKIIMSYNKYHDGFPQKCWTDTEGVPCSEKIVDEDGNTYFSGYGTPDHPCGPF